MTDSKETAMGVSQGLTVGARVRSDSRLFGPVAGVVLGPVRGDGERVWVRWERPLRTWGGPVTTETTARIVDLDVEQGASGGN